MAVDGLIIPRSYNDYINKTDPVALSQALKQNNALDDAPTEDSRGGVRSGGVFNALAGKQPTLTFDNVPTEDSNNPAKSGGIYDALAAIEIPVGTIIAQYKKTAPAGYLYLDGSTFDAAEYPSLYTYLGNNNTLPDYREYSLVGAEQNNTDTIADHDVYTQGQGKDDQMQKVTGSVVTANGTTLGWTVSGALYVTEEKSWAANGVGGLGATKINLDTSKAARTGTTTHGKRKAVYFYIKAVSIADIL